MSLTQTQSLILETLERLHRQNGGTRVTLQAMADELKRSKSAIYEHVVRLVQKGYLTRIGTGPKYVCYIPATATPEAQARQLRERCKMVAAKLRQRGVRGVDDLVTELEALQ